MHIFGSGDFEGLTIEQAILRDAPRLYEIMRWARDKRHPGLQNAIREFDILRAKLRNASITAECAQSGCQATPTSMTLPIDKYGCFHPTPYFWCDEHEPSETRGISPKYPIHFDAISRMKTKGDRESIFSRLKSVLGIKPGTRISAVFAERFFAKLK
jgi:hypothetical protein